MRSFRATGTLGDRCARLSPARFGACSSRSAHLARRVGQPLALPSTADADEEDRTEHHSDDSVGQRRNDQEQPDGGEGEADGQAGASAETAEQGEQDDHVGLLGINGFRAAAVPVWVVAAMGRLTSRPPVRKCRLPPFRHEECHARCDGRRDLNWCAYEVGWTTGKRGVGMSRFLPEPPALTSKAGCPTLPV